MIIFKPLVWIGSLSIEISDGLTACDIDGLIRQIKFRTSNLSGLLELLFVMFSFIFGFLGRYNNIFTNNTYNTFEPVIISIFNLDPQQKQMSCALIGATLGELPLALVNFEAPNQVFYKNVETYKPFITSNIN